MRTVVERQFAKGDRIGWTDVPSTYEAAEAIAGRKLDRRVNYAIIEGEVHSACNWSSTCSGCEGHGCSECGHHGVSRNSVWVPLLPKEYES
ncbi:hypothetical protein Tamer19_17430 [Cupriavidus sp. TA19]|uniref:hypothetical protein n=1 Tax=Cupriavidus sp. TA19 TaxID=701108 RepID=UPI0027294BB6|nr:hypothetical protein [Cupriavidus sp. TA19]GLC92335.1 hypothetical protein Tamer19_17430 [Cupriavidus sp. TA19]